MRRIILLAGIVGALAVQGCGPAPDSSAKPEVVVKDKRLQAGERVFKSRCAGCHKVNGKGGQMAPDLSQEGLKHDKAWILAQIQSPRVHNPKTAMPTLDLDKSELEAVSQYTASLK